MDYISGDIIKSIQCNLSEYDCNSFRQCSTYISMIVGQNYFSSKYITIKQIKTNEAEFNNFVDKYKISLNVSLYTVKDLLYFNNHQHEHKIKSMLIIRQSLFDGMILNK